MSREEIIQFIAALNGSLDIEFLETLSPTELKGYVEHLKAAREKTKAPAERTPVKAGSH